jgi:hypothetical protein
MTRRVMPPGRVSREAVRRVLRRAVIKPLHADHLGRREGVFVRQTTDTTVSVAVDVDDVDSRSSLFEGVRQALEAAGYTLEDASSPDIPRWYVTKPVDGRSESAG